ncbi:MAG: glycosyltransferase [Polyangiaceae bacterium]
MSTLALIAVSVLVVAVAAIGTVFFAYPAVLWMVSRRRVEAVSTPTDWPRASLIIAVRNGAELLRAKLQNAVGLTYPKDRLEVVVFSDGSTDATESVARAHDGLSVVVLSSAEHIGKAAALNRAAAAASGDVLLFSDADARLAPDAIERMVRHLVDPGIGGVCGRRRIGEPGAFLESAQSRYVSMDSLVKQLESRAGSITSNDGKIYCIRRELFAQIPDGVTDDLFVALNVIARGSRFVFEPEAVAFIRVPARDTGHEVRRRRRIVSRSLRGIFLMRRLLNPLRFGRFAFGLMVNKLCRRLLPVWLGLLLLTSAYLASSEMWAVGLLALQGAFYLTAALHLALGRMRGPIGRLSSVAFFFCLGIFGTWLGLVDFFSNRSVTKWDPIKSD